MALTVIGKNPSVLVFQTPQILCGSSAEQKRTAQSRRTNPCLNMFTLPDMHMVYVTSSELKAAAVAQIYTAADAAAVSPAAGHCVNTPSENAKQWLPVRLPALLYNLCIQLRLNSVTALPNRLYPS